jgi:lysophospholipase L1-like esterase
MSQYARRRILPLLLLVLCTTIIAADGPASQPIRIVLMGDSTVCDYPPASVTRGWGQFIAEGFSSPVLVHNFAVGGRSTKTFISEGRLKKALEEPADFALIQFGHNDSHAKDHPEATDAATDYRQNLKTCIGACLAAKVQPILVTPMHRRTFKEGKLTTELLPYANAMKAGARAKQISVIDLYTLSGGLFEKLGNDASVDLNCTPTDHTHFSEKGARALAQLILKELRTLDPRLQTAIRE